jgi:hypothetical protein
VQHELGERRRRIKKLLLRRGACFIIDMDSNAEAAAPICGACGDRERAGDAPHRRGRCRRCYENWVRERPVGLGAFCNSCGERRTANLRHYELRRLWVVLCHNCAARAEALDPQPYTVGGLRIKLTRNRRFGDRRAESVGGSPRTPAYERREGDRRTSERNILDATEFAELVLELEAEFGDVAEDLDPADGPITGVHKLIEPEAL